MKHFQEKNLIKKTREFLKSVVGSKKERFQGALNQILQVSRK